jgi:hypothetical protein
MAIVGRLDQYASMLVNEFDDTTSNNNGISASAGSNGVYYSSEFSENIGVTTLTANVFNPYDIITGEFASVSYGSGNGTYMRQNTDQSVIVYTEIDEVTSFT